MLYGTVIEFFPEKGFGFIQPDIGADVFFHVTALGACQPLPHIKPGQPVKYELVPGTEPKFRRRSPRSDEPPAKPARPQAQLVELIDKIPGRILEETDKKRKPRHHPRTGRRNPTGGDEAISDWRDGKTGLIETTEESRDGSWLTAHERR